MLVARERREAVLAFATKKFSVPERCPIDDKLLEVVMAMFEIEAQS